jgi:hypothetical protein
LARSFATVEADRSSRTIAALSSPAWVLQIEVVTA